MTINLISAENASKYSEYQYKKDSTEKSKKGRKKETPIFSGTVSLESSLKKIFRNEKTYFSFGGMIPFSQSNCC